MSLFDIAAILIGLSALFGYVNYRFLKFPHTIGLVVVALFASGVIIIADSVFAAAHIATLVTDLLDRIDFNNALMNGMLSFLLFAGAVHVDIGALARRKWSISLMATAGVLISTFVIGTATWFIAPGLGLEIPFIWALVFGALISPTDPVAVLGILKTVTIPRSLQAKIAGESLFNDGVGVVVFAIIVAIALGAGDGGHGNIGMVEIARLFAWEAIVGAIFGFVMGYIAYLAMRVIDEHNIEVLITLALVMVTYSISIHLHISGPIAVVIAGLLIGNHGAKFAMSENTRQHVFQFWELIDEILNSVLFLLIGLEVLVVGRNIEFLPIAIAAIPAVLMARWVAVAIPISLLSIRARFTPGAIRILTWGGLRGGISVALALSLPPAPQKPAIVAMTYAVVVFSIIVQGLTMKPLVNLLVKPDTAPLPQEH
jgi:CPA1 family monovalent cation:H+ antiporter